MQDSLSQQNITLVEKKIPLSIIEKRKKNQNLEVQKRQEYDFPKMFTNFSLRK